MPQLTRTPPPARLSHRRFIPWQCTKDDNFHPIAYALRAWSTEAQGKPVHPNQQWGLTRLQTHLAEHQMVVDYNRDEGFFLVPRDPVCDDPDLPIRRPPDY